MIALFTGVGQQFQIFPEKSSKKVVSANDVRGIKFTSVITMGDWYMDEHKRKAFDILQERQPELFKDG